MKNALNNTKLFGFRTNSTEPDLSMIISDIINHLNLHDLNISGMTIVIPDPVHNFENFVIDEDVGIARSLVLEEIVDMNKYGIEIGDFIIRTGQNFTMPKNR